MPNWRRLERKLRRGIDLTRAETARALGVWGGPRAVALLRVGSDDAASFVRRDAVLALARLRADDAADVFLDRLRNDDDTGVRAAAIQGLGAIRAHEAAAEISPFVESRDADLAAAAIRALAEMRGAPLPGVVVSRARDGEADVRVAVLDALAECPCDDAAPVVEAALSDREEAVRYAAVWAAIPHAVRAPRLLAQALLDESETIASAALDAVGVVLGHVALEGYGRIARQWCPAAEREAIAERVYRTIATLPERFESAWFDVVRFRAAEGDRSVVEDLKWALANDRASAAIAIEDLAKLDCDAVAPRLRAIVGNVFSPATVKVAACAALTRFGENRAERAFLRALSSRRAEVRGFATECASWTKSDAVVAALRGRVVEGDSILALGRLRDRTSAQAIAALAEARGDRDLRVDAVWALAAIDTAAWRPVLATLADADGDSVVREAARRALRLENGCQPLVAKFDPVPSTIVGPPVPSLRPSPIDC